MGNVVSIALMVGIPVIIGNLIYYFVGGYKPNQKEEENAIIYDNMGNNNLKVLANRKFQHTNFVGSKTTWTFNEDGSIVNVKAGWLGINSVNTSISIESLGDGKFIGKGLISQKFSLEDNCIKSGPVSLTEIFE